MKSFFDFIKYKSFFLCMVLNVIIKVRNKKYAILFGTPMHGNIGDQTIAYAEHVFFKEQGKKVVEIPDYYALKHAKLWKKLIGKKKIYVHGGGFVGSVWPDMHEMLITIIKTFSDNKIVILPQTIDFGNDEILLDKFNTVLKNATDVTICIREDISYKIYRDKLKNARLLLIPDMVLFLEPFDLGDNKREKITLCMRNDREKSVSDNDIGIFINEIKKEYMNITITDMIVDGFVKNKERRSIYENKIRSFSNSAWVVTDRLHGMVLSYMGGLPTIVLENKNHKVKGLYEWIKESGNIFLVKNLEEALDIISENKALTMRKTIKLDTKFEELVRIVNDEDFA